LSQWRLSGRAKVTAARVDRRKRSPLGRGSPLRLLVLLASLAAGFGSTLLTTTPTAFGAVTSTSSTNTTTGAGATTTATGTTTTVAGTTTTTTSTTTTTVSEPTTTPERPAGYWVVRSNGTVSNFGVPSFGDLSKLKLSQPIVAAAATPDGRGYWLVAANGGVYAFGDAQFEGSPGARSVDKTIVGIAPSPDGGGYWIVASDGSIFAYGDAHSDGSPGGKGLNEPIVAIAATPDGRGYWLVASDGGIFAYGDAHFYGSTGSDHLNEPIVGMASTPDGGGYWLVASDGGIFAYGDADFYGSSGSKVLAAPIVSMVGTPDGKGYWLAEQNGAIFPFGDAPNFGSSVSTTSSAGVVALAVSLTTAPPAGTTTTRAVGTTATSSTTTSRPTTTTNRRTTTTTRRSTTTTTRRTTTTTTRRTTTTTRRTTTTTGRRTTTTTRHTTTTTRRTTTTTRRTTTTTRPPPTTTTVPRPVSGSDPYAPDATGFDVSWPQCLPRGSGRVQALPGSRSFAIVGVNNGTIGGFNSCFATEARWAGQSLSVYIILQAAPGGDPPMEARGPKASCSKTSNNCEGYDWGYNYARADIAFVGEAGVVPKMWWLDIETGENWPTSPSVRGVNAAIIQGALDAIRTAHYKEGIYSTWYQWGEITGSYVPTTRPALWVPGADNVGGDAYSAVAFCARAMSPGDPSKLSSASLGFAHGVPWLVQYGYGGAPSPDGIDPDFACAKSG
jgi:hypothetical protein